MEAISDTSKVIKREQELLDTYFDNGLNCYNIAPTATGGAYNTKPDNERRVYVGLSLSQKTIQLLEESTKQGRRGQTIDKAVKAYLEKASPNE